MINDINYDKIYTGWIADNFFGKFKVLRDYNIVGDAEETGKFKSLHNKFVSNELKTVKGDKSGVEVEMASGLIGDLTLNKHALMQNIKRSLEEQKTKLRKAKYMAVARDKELLYGEAEMLYSDLTKNEKEAL